MVDRQQMMNVVFGGKGTLGNDVFSIYDPSYNSSLPQRTHDPEQAKSLLKSAGVEGLTNDLVTSEIAQGAVPMATVFAQQAKARESQRQRISARMEELRLVHPWKIASAANCAAPLPSARAMDLCSWPGPHVSV